jgi:hypothetical protein
MRVLSFLTGVNEGRAQPPRPAPHRTAASPEVESLAQAAAIVTPLALATAATAEWPLRRLCRRLPLILTRRAMGGTGTTPDPALQRAVELALLPPRRVWLLAGDHMTALVAPHAGDAVALLRRGTVAASP